MSVTGLSETSKLYKKSFHRRNDSDELDVFEAARYFSGYNEVLSAGYNNNNNNNGNSTYTQKIMKEDYRHPWRGGRKSLDVPMRTPMCQQITYQNHSVEKQILKEKKYKQPSSPGGRLASFLNSLFNQTSSKKKKAKSATQSMKDEDESPGGRRKRRSSISHFRSTNSADTKSLYSSSSSGFRTPPAYANTPTKSYKDLRSFSDHKQVINSLSSKQNGNVKSIQNEKHEERKNSVDLSWLDGKTKNLGNNNNNKYSEKDRIWADQYPSEEKEFRKFNEEEEDGNESDSSSDLFELQNYDLGIYSSGLPVYETTNMDSIKRSTAPISNGAI